MTQTTIISRRELFERVWAKPLTKLAPELGISTAQLIKLCQLYNIPRPSNGHWTLLAWGRECQRPELPAAASPDKEQIEIASAEVQKRSDNDSLTIAVPSRLTSPHRLVAAAATMLNSRKRDREGLVYSGGRNAVRIAVSSQNIGRALRIMDVFVKEMEARGFALQPEGNDAYANIALSRDFRMYPLKLREHLKRTALPLTPTQVEQIRKWGHCSADRYEYTPDGQLVLSFGHDYDASVTQDTTNTRLEDKLGRFVARILRRVAQDEEIAQRRAEEAAARERERAEIRRREEEAARLQKEEQERVDAIEDTIARWKLSKDIRGYLAEMRSLIESHHAQATEGGLVARWLEWAEAYAARIDPFTPLRAELVKIRDMQLQAMNASGSACC